MDKSPLRTPYSRFRSEPNPNIHCWNAPVWQLFAGANPCIARRSVRSRREHIFRANCCGGALGAGHHENRSNFSCIEGRRSTVHQRHGATDRFVCVSCWFLVTLMSTCSHKPWRPAQFRWLPFLHGQALAKLLASRIDSLDAANGMCTQCSLVQVVLRALLPTPCFVVPIYSVADIRRRLFICAVIPWTPVLAATAINSSRGRLLLPILSAILASTTMCTGKPSTPLHP